MREGFRCGMKLELIYGVAVFAVCFLFARPLMLLFVKDEEVIRHGVSYLHLIAAMYLLPAATNGIQGYFRGIGDLKITLISSFINMGVRVLAALPLVFLMGMGIEALPLSGILHTQEPEENLNVLLLFQFFGNSNQFFVPFFTELTD